MRFIDNFSEANLIFGESVCFDILDDNNQIVHSFHMDMPKFKHIQFDIFFQRFAGVLNAPILKLQEQFQFMLNFESHYQLYLGLMIIKHPSIKRYIEEMEYVFQLLGVDFHCGTEDDDLHMYIGNVVVEEALFTRMIRLILMACSLKKQGDFIDDPVMRAYQEKIDRIKSQGKKQMQGGMQQGEMQNMFMVLSYEFGYKQEEILNMTQYAINLVLSYTGKSIRYKTTLIAAGNGNTKKVKFITDKGK